MSLLIEQTNRSAGQIHHLSVDDDHLKQGYGQSAAGGRLGRDDDGRCGQAFQKVGDVEVCEYA